MLQQQQDISLVIFDFDGVIVDSEVISKSVLTRLLLERGVRLSDAYYFTHFLGHSYAHCCQKVLEDFELVIGDEFLQIYQSELKAAFARDLTVTPGLLTMLEALGGKCCIATSSTPERVKNALKTVGLTDFFYQQCVYSFAGTTWQTRAGSVFICSRPAASRTIILFGH